MNSNICLASLLNTTAQIVLFIFHRSHTLSRFLTILVYLICILFPPLLLLAVLFYFLNLLNLKKILASIRNLLMVSTIFPSSVHFSIPYKLVHILNIPLVKQYSLVEILMFYTFRLLSTFYST